MQTSPNWYTWLLISAEELLQNEGFFSPPHVAAVYQLARSVLSHDVLVHIPPFPPSALKATSESRRRLDDASLPWNISFPAHAPHPESP